MVEHCGVTLGVPEIATKASPVACPDPRPLRRTDLTVHELDAEALVFDAASGDTHRLNETALFIWRRCDGRRNAQQVAADLAEVYDVSLKSALEHVDRTFAEFLQRSLVMTTG